MMVLDHGRYYDLLIPGLVPQLSIVSRTKKTKVRFSMTDCKIMISTFTLQNTEINHLPPKVMKKSF